MAPHLGEGFHGHGEPQAVILDPKLKLKAEPNVFYFAGCGSGVVAAGIGEPDCMHSESLQSQLTMTA